MKKDFIYEDKGQFRLMQNAEKMGGFVAGDQGVIPSERVLPEQRFAHQPIFRRPPEELVTVFSYIHNFNQGVFSSTNHDIKVANLFKKSSTTNPDGVHLLYKYTGWVSSPLVHNILLKNTNTELQTTHRLNPLGGGGFNWIPLDSSFIQSYFEGFTLFTGNYPILFRDYIFFRASLNNTDAVYYAKLNAKKIETKEIKIAVHDHEKAFYELGWIYADDADPNYGFKLAVYQQDSGVYGPPWNPYSDNLVQYKANSLEGPWVYDKTWNTYNLIWGSPAYTAIVQELAALVLSKPHNNLSITLASSQLRSNWPIYDALVEAYAPPYTTSDGAWVYSRGNEGEIVRIFTPPAKNYLIKRQGNGQMKKTLITDIDNGFFD